MLIMCDFIGSSNELIPATLVSHIQQIGEIQEVRAVANKSISVNHTSVVSEVQNKQSIPASDLLTNPNIENNLFIYWLIHTKTKNN